MNYFYLSCPPSYQKNMWSVEKEITKLFKINYGNTGGSLYNYFDIEYKVKTKEKYNKIKKYINQNHPKIKVIWTGKESSWD